MVWILKWKQAYTLLRDNWWEYTANVLFFYCKVQFYIIK
jgi:hypothetical protein